MSLLAAVIFDFDGLIFDSETPEYESHQQVFASCGVDLTLDEWCNQIGVWAQGHDEGWADQLVVRAASAPTREVYLAEKRRIFNEVMPGGPMRGIRELLDALADAGVRTAVASTSSSKWVLTSIDRLGLQSSFGAIVTGSDVTQRKPAPDVYLEAARRLNVDPSRSVALEDSGPGLKAAKAAGMKAVAIPHWLTERHDLSAADLQVAHAGELTLERLAALIQA